jgi:hypothetical protein
MLKSALWFGHELPAGDNTVGLAARLIRMLTGQTRRGPATQFKAREQELA